MGSHINNKIEITEQALPALNRLIWTISIFFVIQPILFLLINWKVLVIYSLFDNIVWVSLSYITVLTIFYSYNKWGSMHLFITDTGFIVQRGFFKRISEYNFDKGLSIQSSVNNGLTPSLSILSLDNRVNIPLRLLSYDKTTEHILPIFKNSEQVEFQKFIDYYYDIFNLQEEDNTVALVAVHVLFPASIIFGYYIWGVSQFFTIFWTTFSITVPLIWSSTAAIIYRINNHSFINITPYTVRLITGFLAVSIYLFYGYIFKIAFVFR